MMNEKIKYRKHRKTHKMTLFCISSVSSVNSVVFSVSKKEYHYIHNILLYIIIGFISCY